MRGASTIGNYLLLVGGPLAAQGKAPVPAFSAAFSFRETMARTFASECPNPAFDCAGCDRHVRALIGEHRDRGHHSRRIGQLFAPIQPERGRSHPEAFLQKYDLTENSQNAEYCDAGAAEAEWLTPNGRMLKVVEE